MTKHYHLILSLTLSCAMPMSIYACNTQTNNTEVNTDATKIDTNEQVKPVDTAKSIIAVDSVKICKPIEAKDTITNSNAKKTMTAADYDREFVKMGFVDVQTLDPAIQVDLKYSSTDNFMGINIYGDLYKSYLRPEIAEMVVKAQKYIKQVNPEYSLVIYDAARPLSAQRMMYEKVQGTKFSDYVAKPVNGGGYHNFGCAVDVTILHKGKPLDMGAGFDEFSEMSHIDNEDVNLKNGKLSKEAYDNRQVLRNAMKKAGFGTYRCEWWHFQHYTKQYMRTHFKSIDF